MKKLTIKTIRKEIANAQVKPASDIQILAQTMLKILTHLKHVEERLHNKQQESVLLSDLSENLSGLSRACSEAWRVKENPDLIVGQLNGVCDAIERLAHVDINVNFGTPKKGVRHG